MVPDLEICRSRWYLELPNVTVQNVIDELGAEPESVFLNNTRLTPQSWAETILHPSDQLAVMCPPEGIGAAIVSAIASVASAGTAAGAAGAAAGTVGGLAGIGAAAGAAGFAAGATAGSSLLAATGAFLLDMAIHTALSFGIGALVNALAPSPATSDLGTDMDSAFFNEVVNATANGTPIPLLLGEHLVGGILVSSYTQVSWLDRLDEWVHMMICLGDGPWYQIMDWTADGNYESSSSPTDGTCLINDAYISSFSGTRLSWRMGATEQRRLPGFFEDRQEKSWNEEVPYAASPPTGVIEYTTTQKVHGFTLKLRFPLGLYHINRHAHQRSHQLYLRVQYKPEDSSTWSDVESVDFMDSVTAPHVREYSVVDLDYAVYDIRVWSANEIESSNQRFNQAYVSSIIERIDATSAYPGRAMLWVERLSAKQLSGALPKVTVKCKGILCPRWTVADAWDNTKAYSSNPAWLVAELLTNTHYGLGERFSTSNLDGQSFKDWADYCDALVAYKKIDEDGNIDEGTEVRHRCDAYLVGQRSAWETIIEICASARAALFFNGTTVKIKIDQDAEPVYMFSYGSILKDTFTTSYANLTSKANVVEVEFSDAESDYQRTAIPVESETSLSGDPQNRVTTTVRGFGVTRATEAMRFGTFLLNKNRLLTKTIEFEVGEEGLAVEPGDIVMVQHPTPGYGDVEGGGRVVSATPTTVTLDRWYDYSDGTTYEISVRQADDTVETQELTTSGSGKAKTFTIADSGTWASTPSGGEPYAIGEQNLSTKEFRVLSMSRGDVGIRLSCIEHDAAIYSDTPDATPTAAKSTLPNPARIPSDINEDYLTARERTILGEDGTSLTYVDVSFQYPEDTYGLRGVQVYWKHSDDTNWVLAGETTTGEFTLSSQLFVSGYTVDVSVVPVSMYGASKNPDDGAQAQVYLSGPDIPPDVTGFVASRVGDSNAWTLRWTPGTDDDGYVPENIAGYQIRKGTNWGAGIVVAKLATGTEYTTTDIEDYLDTGTSGVQFHIKAVNTSGFYSANADSVAIGIAYRPNVNIQQTPDDERSDSWDGTLDDFSVVGSYIELDDGEADGTYTCDAIDGNRVSQMRLYLRTEIEQLSTLTWADATFTWGSAEALTTTWSAQDQGIDISVEYRYHDTAIGSGTWETFVNGKELVTRYVQWRITATRLIDWYSCRIKDIIQVIDAPDVIDGGEGVLVTGSSQQVNFSKELYGGSGASSIDPSVSVVLTDPQNGDYISISGIDIASATQHFHVTVYDSGDTVVTSSSSPQRHFNWFSRGW